jgi:hypothetical protein
LYWSWPRRDDSIYPMVIVRWWNSSSVSMGTKEGRILLGGVLRNFQKETTIYECIILRGTCCLSYPQKKRRWEVDASNNFCNAVTLKLSRNSGTRRLGCPGTIAGFWKSKWPKLDIWNND